MALALADRKTGLRLASQNWIDNLLDKYVYLPGEALKIKGAAFLARDGRLNITGPRGIKASVDEPPTEIGVYNIQWGDETGSLHNEPFLVVTPEYITGLVKKLEQNLEQILPATQSAVHFLIQRVTFLSDPSNRRWEKEMGDREYVERVIEMMHLADAVSAPNSSDTASGKIVKASDRIANIYQMPGKHFIAYEGRLSKYKYSLAEIYVPSKSVAKSAPLVVVVPSTAITRPEPYRSYMLEWRDLNQCYIDAADATGCVTVWPMGENVEHSSEVERDLVVCIQYVVGTLHCDAKRVMVMGGCGAGRDTLIFAAKYPDVVFCAAAQEPLLTPHYLSAGRSGDLAGVTPAAYIKELSRMNVFLSHGEQDRHVGIGTTRQFAADLIRAGGKPYLDLISGADEGYFPRQNKQWIADAYDYFVKIP